MSSIKLDKTNGVKLGNVEFNIIFDCLVLGDDKRSIRSEFWFFYSLVEERNLHCCPEYHYIVCMKFEEILSLVQLKELVLAGFIKIHHSFHTV